MTENTHLNKQVQSGMREMMAQHDWDFFVTANLHKPWRWESAKRLLRDWHASVDRRLLSGRWQRKTDQRTFFIACCENSVVNTHWHLMVKVAAEKQDRFAEIASALWVNGIASGTMDVQAIPSKQDADRAAGYALKDLWTRQGIEQFVISTEFSGG
jgi:hypothetical protein